VGPAWTQRLEGKTFASAGDQTSRINKVVLGALFFLLGTDNSALGVRVVTTLYTEVSVVFNRE
jgi:hypothetical protein